MKLYKDDLDIAARRAVQFRDEEQQNELDQKQIDISNDRIYEDEYKHAGIWALAFFIVMFGGVLQTINFGRMEFKIQVEVDGDWITLDWSSLNESILFGNDLTNNRKRFWTGLKDKNGKEIYEGDVVRLFHGHPSWLTDPFEVVFQCSAFALKKKDKKGSTAFATYLHDCVTNGIISDDDDESALFEVIGNIHENPDLIQ